MYQPDFRSTEEIQLRGTYVRRHERNCRRIVCRHDADLSCFGEDCRDEDAAQHGDEAAVAVPVQRLRDGDANVDEPVGADEPVPDAIRLLRIVEEEKEPIQDERLTYCEGKLHEARDDDGGQRPAQSEQTRSDEAVFV